VETEALDTSQLEKIDSLQKVFNELRDDDWRFGQSPAFRCVRGFHEDLGFGV